MRGPKKVIPFIGRIKQSMRFVWLTGRHYYENGVRSRVEINEAIASLGYFFWRGSPEHGIPALGSHNRARKRLIRIVLKRSGIDPDQFKYHINNFVTWRPPDFPEGIPTCQQQAGNLRRTTDSRRRMREVYFAYLKKHGVPPSRNALVKLAKCGREQAAKFLQKAPPARWLLDCSGDPW